MLHLKVVIRIIQMTENKRRGDNEKEADNAPNSHVLLIMPSMWIQITDYTAHQITCALYLMP